jgi:hypothetical protein
MIHKAKKGEFSALKVLFHDANAKCTSCKHSTLKKKGGQHMFHPRDESRYEEKVLLPEKYWRKSVVASEENMAFDIANVLVDCLHQTCCADFAILNS